jgi:hypothetical protein
MDTRKPVSLAGVKMRRVKYAVEGLVPLGRLSFLVGRPGATKTMVVIDLGAQVTRGGVKGDLEHRPSHVLYVTMENSLTESLAPRAEAAKAVPGRFHIFRDNLNLPEEIDFLRRLIIETKAKLVVFDTVSDYITLSVVNSQQNAKRAFQPLASLAEELGVAIVAIFWANKSGRGLNAVAGSVGNSGTARNVIVVGQLSGNENVIGTIKANDGPDHFGWVYSWQPVEVSNGDGELIHAPKIEWEQARKANPAEIDLAFEQVKLTDDPAAVPLLEYMAEKMANWTDEPPPSPNAGWFPTDELITVIEQATLCGTTAARKVVNRALAAGLIERWRGGQGESFQVAWRITDLGRLWLGDDEEDSIHGWFHTDRRKSRAATKRTRKPQPLALPKGSG